MKIDRRQRGRLCELRHLGGSCDKRSLTDLSDSKKRRRVISMITIKRERRLVENCGLRLVH
jgi:hypothetical protein